MGQKPTIAEAIRAQLDPSARARGLSPFNQALVIAILVSALLAILETEPAIGRTYPSAFRAAELSLGLLFAAEYGLRLWIAGGTGEDHPWSRRMRWILSPAALIDLAALLPMVFVLGTPTALLRIVRLIRIFRLAKLGRLSRAWRLIGEAVYERRYELMLSIVAALIAMLAAGVLLYLVEGPRQPEQFGSIPRALWWSVTTLTTIGYGDAYPETTIGKLLTAAFAVVGIGLIAAPTGILAGAFSAAYQRRGGADVAVSTEER